MAQISEYQHHRSLNCNNSSWRWHCPRGPVTDFHTEDVFFFLDPETQIGAERTTLAYTGTEISSEGMIVLRASSVVKKAASNRNLFQVLLSASSWKKDNCTSVPYARQGCPRVVATLRGPAAKTAEQRRGQAGLVGCREPLCRPPVEMLEDRVHTGVELGAGRPRGWAHPGRGSAQELSSLRGDSQRRGALPVAHRSRRGEARAPSSFFPVEDTGDLRVHPSS